MVSGMTLESTNWPRHTYIPHSENLVTLYTYIFTWSLLVPLEEVISIASSLIRIQVCPGCDVTNKNVSRGACAVIKFYT